MNSVQTNPNIDSGSVQVQVTLKNRSDKSVSSDVTVTVYELGIFENGISSQTEVKAGEYTHKGVSVSENGTATFTIDEIKLDNCGQKINAGLPILLTIMAITCRAESSAKHLTIANIILYHRRD